MITDSHCHLNYPEFTGNLEPTLQRAVAAGVSRFVTISTKLEEIEQHKNIAHSFEPVFYTAGVHPHQAADYTLEAMETQLSVAALDAKMIGFGETGLDYYYNHSPREAQIASFEKHLDLATRFDLPVIIHTRNADDDTLAVLDNFPNARGVFHCFSGSPALAKAALDKGFYLSFSGIITFKKAADLGDVVRETPLERMLVETDAPYLAPEPYRGKPNEPAWVYHVAEKVAIIKGLSLAEVAEQTTANFLTLFTKAV